MLDLATTVFKSTAIDLNHMTQCVSFAPVSETRIVYRIYHYRLL